MLNRIVFIVLILILVNISTLASQINTSKPDTLTYTTIQQDDSKLSDTQAYKLLYEDAKNSNASIINTMQWSIGIVLALLLAIIGSQIFHNFRINKKEIENIRQSLNDNFLKFETNLTSIVEKDKIENIKNINNQVSDLRKELNNTFGKLFIEKSKSIETKNKSLEEKINNNYKEINFVIDNLKIDIEKCVGDLWILKGIKENALSNFIRTAELKIKKNFDVKYILKEINSILSEVTEIFEHDYLNLTELIKIIPKEHKNIRDEIQQHLIKIPIFKFVNIPDTKLGLEFSKVYIRK